MEVIIRKDTQSAADLVCQVIVEQIKKRPTSVLGLATGRTMELLYKMLVDRYKAGEVDFSLCRSFNLDEYVGLTKEDEQSYRAYMNHHLFSKVNIDIRNTHVPHGTEKDLDWECKRYDDLINECGGIDLQLLGIGQDGHIGFNEPGSSLRSRTRVKALAPETMEQNRPLFKDPSKMPRRAITMGVGTILESRRTIMLATGSSKAAIIHKAVEGPITSMVTASALQLHPHATIIVDEAASEQLEFKDHYKWVFENEPEWIDFQ